MAKRPGEPEASPSCPAPQRPAESPPPGGVPGPARRGSELQKLVCPICGALMIGVHCKLICENCGYREDCSDLF